MRTGRPREILRTYSNIAWTYVTPALNSSADCAEPMIDIIERHQYVREQITLVSGRNPDPQQPWWTVKRLHLVKIVPLFARDQR